MSSSSKVGTSSSAGFQNVGFARQIALPTTTVSATTCWSKNGLRHALMAHRSTRRMQSHADGEDTIAGAAP